MSTFKICSTEETEREKIQNVWFHSNVNGLFYPQVWAWLPLIRKNLKEANGLNTSSYALPQLPHLEARGWLCAPVRKGGG